MEDEITIKGNFTVEGLGSKLMRQPLKYLKLKLTKIPIVQVDGFSSVEENPTMCKKCHKDYQIYGHNGLCDDCRAKAVREL